MSLDTRATLDNLATRFKSEFDEEQKRRRQHEERWLKDLRQYRGEYEPEVLARMHAKRSRAFMRLTKIKVRTFLAQLMDLQFPGGKTKNWVISPTPNPDLPQEYVRMALQTVAAEAGQPPNPDEIDMVLREFAADRARDMARDMEDQLKERPGRQSYREKVRSVKKSALIYGTGVLKGPLVESRTRKAWTFVGMDNDEQPKFELQTQEEELRPYMEFVEIWDVYPDSQARTPEQMNYIWQMHTMKKADVQALAGTKGFSGPVIRKHLEDNADGDATMLNHERQLKDMNKDEPAAQMKNRYRLYERWGFVSGRALLEAGISDSQLLDSAKRAEMLAELAEDHADATGAEIQAKFRAWVENMEFAANVWMIGDKICKLAAEPVKGVHIPFYFYYYDKDETSIFGEGLPADIRDPQSALNGAVRAMLDHAAITAGPQIGLNMSAIEDPDDTEVQPFKTWKFNDVQDMDQAMKFFYMNSHTSEFMAMVEFFKNFLDEMSGPRYMHGDSKVSGAGRTARGLSMLMGAMGTIFKDLVKGFDDQITQPFITALYHWNMQFNPDWRVKGDFEIQALGSSALMAKEIQFENYLRAAEISRDPDFGPWVKKRELMERMFRQLDGAEDLVRSDEEFTAHMQRQKTMEAQANLEAGMNMMAQKVGPEAAEDWLKETVRGAVQGQAVAMMQGGAAQ